MADTKYISILQYGSDQYHIKDSEARAEIADIKSSITGAMHYIGVSSTAIADGDATGPWTINSKTYIASGTPAEGQILLKAGDVAVYAPSGKTEREFVWSGDKWQEYGSTGSLKALAFKDNASGSVTAAGSNAPSAVTFTGGSTETVLKAVDTAAVAPSFTEGAFSAGSLPSFTEGAFTPAAIQTGFATAGSAASFTEGAFSQGTLPSLGSATTGTFVTGYNNDAVAPSLGAATTGNFATEGVTATVDEANETVVFSAASTSAAVTAQGTFSAGSAATLATASAVTAQGAFNAGTLPSKAADTFVANVPTVIDTTKFSGGAKAADTWNAGSLPSKEADTFSAGSAATFTTETVVTSIGTGEAAAQTFTGSAVSVTVS